MAGQQPILNSDLRVTEIGVHGLFGMYNHTIKLNSDERITIIHGINGIGKTIFLEMVNNFLLGKYADTVSMLIEKKTNEIYYILNDCVFVSLSKVNGVFVLTVIDSGSNKKFSIDSKGKIDGLSEDELKAIGDKLREIYPMGVGGIYSLPSLNYIDPIEFPENFDEKNWLAYWAIIVGEFLKYNLSSYFIESNRFCPKEPPSGVLPKQKQYYEFLNIQEVNEDLQNLIRNYLDYYWRKNSELERSFPQRLIDFSGEDLNIFDIKEKLSRINAQFNYYVDMSLFDMGVFNFNVDNLECLNKSRYFAIELYIEDTIEKLKEIEPLVNRIESFIEQVNRRLIDKKVFIKRDASRDRLSARFVLKDALNNDLELNDISLGEKSIILLFYNLLFRVKPRSLVMIDEPEMGLHVSWQDSFVDDLKAIIKIAQFDVILATHSPYIIGDHSNLMVALSAKQAKVAN